MAKKVYASGKFTSGNTYGRGSQPFGGQVQKWRAVFAGTVTEDDIKATVSQLVQAARAGQRWAVTEQLNRTCGSLVEAELADRLSALEDAISTEGDQ